MNQSEYKTRQSTVSNLGIQYGRTDKPKRDKWHRDFFYLPHGQRWREK